MFSGQVIFVQINRNSVSLKQTYTGSGLYYV